MMESTMNPGMCRCCASEGAFKDIKSVYHWMGEEEIYADMLRECFDIILNASEQGHDGGICEVCITQLRNAINFKKQVLHTEAQFQKHLQNKTLFRPHIVKVEVHGEEDSDDNMGSGDEGFSGPEFEVPIKTEVDDPKPKKRAAAKASATTTRASAKKAKAEQGETSTKRNPVTVSKKSEIKNLEPAVLVIVEPERKKKERTQVTNSIQASVAELSKHRHNVRQVLQCSNATPLMRRGGTGYVCSYCFGEFPEARDLKTHTLAEHSSTSDPRTGYSKKIKSMSEYSVKLDITNLKCTECGSSIDSLEDLLNHIQQEHNKVLHTDIKNHIIPFKFETDALTCCLCPSTFDKFKMLQEHMHSHYRNYVCDICDSGFFMQGSYTRHRSTHLKGVFPCSFCSKVYDTLLKKRSHERCNHTHTDVLNRCAYCNKGFRDYHSRELHMSEVHGAKATQYKCNACDRCYSTKRKLRIHVKRDHLLERRHKCYTCDMSFFSSHDVKKHMLTHTGEKEFQCEICLKSYGRKSTLSSHMRIHTNDRRFECKFCGMSFVQKCSWKTHLKMKHLGETIL